MSDYRETLYEGYGQCLRMDRLLHEVQAAYGHLVIFENPRMGRVMALDGVVQTTEADEFIYHEMLAHVPILAHGAAKRVLIVGGGDGGTLREVRRHRDVESITLVEIDGALLELCREHLPNHSCGAFEDPRLSLVIGDGLHFVGGTRETFDVIIVDSTDPQGPGQALFCADFYRACRRCLNEGGILVAQNGTPFLQLSQVQHSAGCLDELFADWHFYLAAVPTYIGGSMAFAWGASDPEYRKLSSEVLLQRFAGSGIVTRYYNPEIHRGAFALPQYVLQAVNKPSND
ncbi:MAG: polyamine aminopropyltransferase [Pseudomonadaceae bacterium]|nr:polyamine aminopropyltransferase [Pseudomonadaceae bacterium]